MHRKKVLLDLAGLAALAVNITIVLGFLTLWTSQHAEMPGLPLGWVLAFDVLNLIFAAALVISLVYFLKEIGNAVKSSKRRLPDMVTF
ncbi:MAG: hypothetical protein JWN89_233 [Parcubacteria group bacterium]|nr:hypothetical protein [Parcubacteria group bacterium]